MEIWYARVDIMFWAVFLVASALDKRNEATVIFVVAKRSLASDLPIAVLPTPADPNSHITSDFSRPVPLAHSASRLRIATRVLG